MLARYFDTHILPAVRCEAGEIVSSSRIRALKAAGRSNEAARLEGWPGIRFDRRSSVNFPVTNGGYHV
jgi:hypothetical protein